MNSLTGLRAGSESGRFTFEATPELCVPGMFVFGGATASAVVEAIEATCEQPLAWATTQFQRRIEPGATVELTVTKDVERRRLVQCRVEATVAGETVVRALGAAAERAPDPLTWGGGMPSVAPPGESRPLAFREGWMASGFPSRFEWRLARGRLFADADPGPNEDGHASVWVRWPGHELGGAASQAYFSDLGMATADSAVASAGRGGVSLDNTLRVVATEPTGWMLLDCSIRAHVGVAHVEIAVWAESGALLGLHTTTALHGRG